MSVSSRKTVLLVEDNEDDVILLRITWRKAKLPHALHAVEDGRQALDFVGERGAPDLILLDLQMPGMDGFEVLREVRARPALDATRVVILSSSPEPRDVARAYAEGADSYLTKPAAADTLRELFACVEEAGARTAGGRLVLSRAESPPRKYPPPSFRFSSSSPEALNPLSP